MISLYEHCIEANKIDLLSEWASNLNHDLSPETIAMGSGKKVWWRCGKGHEFQSVVYSRTNGGTGCPYCAGRKVLPGFNDLASQNPELIAQWHTTRNGELTPVQVTPRSNRIVWWICEKGHEWQATVSSRSTGAQCPVCTHHTITPGENDLRTTDPETAAQWHPTRNGTVTPESVFSGSTKKVWWVCEKGHEWQATIGSRKKTGCPYCSNVKVLPGYNDLATTFPELSLQLHPTKNGELTATTVTSGSTKKVWWICEKGHEWQAIISTRAGRKDGCPYCSGRRVLAGFNDLATTAPAIAAQWHPTLNQDLSPEMVTAGSRKRAWWQCAEGHVWQTVIAARKYHNCPVCAGKTKIRTRTKQEQNSAY